MLDQCDLSPAETAALGWALGEMGSGPAVAPPAFAPAFTTFRSTSLGRLARSESLTLAGVARDRGMVAATLLNTKGQSFELRLRLDGDLLSLTAFGMLPPDGFKLREAEENDAATIAAIERDSPIQIADGRSFAVYRPRLGDFFRLQQRNWKALIEHNGEAVAARVLAARSVKLRGGKELVLATSQTARVLPAMRGFNLMRCFGLWVGVEAIPQCDWIVAYVDPGNQAVNAAFRTEAQQWRRRVLELTFRCDHIAGPTYGHAASHNDAGRLAALSNLAHGREAIYGELDARTFAMKLDRAPDVYSWGDVLLSEHAMLGVWPSLDKTTDSADGCEPKRRTMSVALDYGFQAEAGLEDLLRLFRAQASRLLKAGSTHVTLYTHPGSSVSERLSSLAEERGEIAIQTAFPEPADAEGVFTDPLYL